VRKRAGVFARKVAPEHHENAAQRFRLMRATLEWARR
jgi:hypothetical protein